MFMLLMEERMRQGISIMNQKQTPEILIVGNPNTGELSGLNYLLQSLGYKSTIIERLRQDSPTPLSQLQPGLQRLSSPEKQLPPQTLSLVHWPTWRDSERASCDLSTLCNRLTNKYRIALIGCERDMDFEAGALRAGLDGIFHRGERLDIIVKGVAAIFKGELWFSRIVLGEVIRQWRGGKKEVANESSDVLKSLTRRERAVIELLTMGARNKEIADELNISAHTVKAHVYSIFKKTNSRNRVEVINWANRYQRFLMST